MSSSSTGSCDSNAAQKEHVLLTVLGRQPRSARYQLEDSEIVESDLAPLALYKLLPPADQPDCIVALCTPEAEEESWPLLENALDDQCRTELVQVPGGETPAEIDDYMQRAAQAIPDNADITVDVTHGFRHFSFLTYMVVLYLSALRDMRVRGAWYGLLRGNGASPFLDLRGLLELPRWVYAIRALDDTGSAKPMARILGHDAETQLAKRMERDLTRLSQAYLSGLPLETGQQAGIVRKCLIKPLRRLILNDCHLPLGNELADRVGHALKPLALPVSSGGWKGEVVLTAGELKRQARQIDNLLQHGHVATVLGLMSEWTVSWVLWSQGQTEEWLDYNKQRRSAHNLLNAIAAVGEDKVLGDQLSAHQHRLGLYWRLLRDDLRNGYAHHGMRSQSLIGDPKIEKSLGHVRQYWKETLRHCPRVPLSLGAQPGRCVLVSPIGKRPGVLFSALRACREQAEEPAMLIVICSPDTEADIPDAVSAADYAGEVSMLRLDDPFGGVSEIERLEREVRCHFVGAGEVVVNVTGGTTLMGLVAEEVAKAARNLACPVRRFGLIDRRPPAEQERVPWQAGEPFWLDGNRELGKG